MVLRSSILLVLSFAAALNGSAATLYLHSADFFAALAGNPVQIEDFSTAHDGQLVSDGSTLDGLAYGPFTLTGNATQLDITDLYGSISGMSLGADHTQHGALPGATYFYGNEGTRITFAAPVYAVGVFFNVNPGSGLFSVVTTEGTVVNDATFLESSMLSTTLIFAGLISDHAFVSVEILSQGDDAVYNVAEIASAEQAPEPSTFVLGCVAIGLGAMTRRLRRARS